MPKLVYRRYVSQLGLSHVAITNNSQIRVALEKQRCLSDLHSMPTTVWLCFLPKCFHSRSQAVGAVPYGTLWVLWQNQAVAPAEVAHVRLSDIHWPRAWITPQGGAANISNLTWSPRQGTEDGQLLNSLQD